MHANPLGWARHPEVLTKCYESLEEVKWDTKPSSRGLTFDKSGLLLLLMQEKRERTKKIQ
jgi:hypothetical protein